MTLQAHWILTADERQAHLYSCQKNVGPGWHVDHKQSLESRWEDYHDHHRPYALDGRPSLASGMHFTAGFSEKEEQEEDRRFARDVRHWLERAMCDHKIEHIAAFAATRFLAPLRHELVHLGDRVALHDAELTRLSAADLSNHPRVQEVLQSHVAAR